MGLYAMYGISVTTSIVFPPAAAAALAGGSLQFTDFGFGDWLQQSIANPNMIAIGIPSPKTSPFYLMVNPSITTPQQLIGKTVALGVPPGGPSEFSVQYILGTFGLNESQVQVVFLPANLDLSALLSGKADAAVISPPRNIEAADNGFKQMGPVSTDTAFSTPDVLATSRSYLASNPVVVDNFLKGTLQAYRYIYVTMKIVSGDTSSLSSAAEAGVNATQVVSLLSTFTGFNTSLVRQTLKIYNDKNLLNPTMMNVSSTFQAGYYQVLARYPQTASVNVTDIQNLSLVNQLNAPCGFVYNIWGGSPPAPLK